MRSADGSPIFSLPDHSKWFTLFQALVDCRFKPPAPYTSMAHDTLGSRLHAARRDMEFTLEDVANRVGVSPQAVQQWEKDLKIPRVSSLLAVAKVLHVSVEYLWTGKRSNLGEDLRQRNSRGVTVPLLTKEQVSVFPTDTDTTRYFQTYFESSESSFAIDVWDNSNAPKFALGDRIVIDPEVRQSPGKMTLVVIGPPAELVFGRLREASNGDEVALEVCPLNPDWAPRRLTETSRIVGTLAEHARSYL